MSGKHVHRPDPRHGSLAFGYACAECGRPIRWVPEEPNRRGYWTPTVSRETVKPRGSR